MKNHIDDNTDGGEKGRQGYSALCEPLSKIKKNKQGVGRDRFRSRGTKYGKTSLKSVKAIVGSPRKEGRSVLTFLRRERRGQ